MKKTVLPICALCALLVAGGAHGQVPFPFPFPFPSPFPDLGGHDFISDALSRMDRALADDDPTLEDAYFLGRAVAAHILAIYPPYTANPALTRYANRILQTLVINSSRPVAFRGFSIAILDSDELNAFATPGGHIFLTRALVAAATSEDMLAAFIAHELAHVILDHGLAMINVMAFYAEVAETARRAMEFTAASGVSTANAARLMGFRDSVADMVEVLVRSGYSREQEFAADAEAVAILAAAGYNPSAMLDALEVLRRNQTVGTGGFFDTHPPPADRIRSVQAAVSRHRVPDTGSHRLERFRQIR